MPSGFPKTYLLVSTPLHIFKVDPMSGQTEIVRLGDGYYYGISSKNDSIALTTTAGRVKIFSGKGLRQQSERTLSQPHQVEWVGDSLLVTNTGRNCISVFDENAVFQRDVFLNELRFDNKNKGRFGNHFNSVHREKDKVLVVAHNYEKPSRIFQLSWPELNVLGSRECGANWAHNVWECEYGQVICNSKAGTLHEVQQNRLLWQPDQQPVFTRGLSSSDQYIFVGKSAHSSRNRRFWDDGGIWVIDRSRLKTLHYIPLPGSGNVHEIRLVNQGDHCHNGQIITEGMIQSLREDSRVIRYAYYFRRSLVWLRKDVFPLSQMVRLTQFLKRK